MVSGGEGAREEVGEMFEAACWCYVSWGLKGLLENFFVGGCDGFAVNLFGSCLRVFWAEWAPISPTSVLSMILFVFK